MKRDPDKLGNGRWGPRSLGLAVATSPSSDIKPRGTQLCASRPRRPHEAPSHLPQHVSSSEALRPKGFDSYCPLAGPYQTPTGQIWSGLYSGKVADHTTKAKSVREPANRVAQLGSELEN
jgi:hypothetical protein